MEAVGVIHAEVTSRPAEANPHEYQAGHTGLCYSQPRSLEKHRHWGYGLMVSPRSIRSSCVKMKVYRSRTIRLLCGGNSQEVTPPIGVKCSLRVQER